MIFLSEFSIKQFRGIKDLRISDLGNINLIVGDNNSGKTSVLEAMMFLRNISDFSNVLSVVRLRDSGIISPNRMSAYDNFLYMFDPEEQEKCIVVSGEFGEKTAEFNLYGTIENVLVDVTEVHNMSRKAHEMYNASTAIYSDTETFEFQGILEGKIDDKVLCEEKITFNPYTRLSGVKASKPENIEIIYVSPTEHTSSNVFSKIIRNNQYKEDVLQVLRIFDEEIEDLLYLKNEQTFRPIECIKHKRLGNMPLTTYGDGIKKVLLLSNSIVKARGGILLVDEIETAIHARHYNDIFEFVINACQKFDIQLFATTHSIEAVDGFLATQYDKSDDIYDENNYDLLRVITFRRNVEKAKTDARVLSGKDVFNNRKNFEFEVRL